jgi:hypothetical protein
VIVIPDRYLATISKLLYLSGYWLLFVATVYSCFFKPGARSLRLSLEYLTSGTPIALVTGVLLLTGAVISLLGAQYQYLTLSVSITLSLSLFFLSLG